MRKTLPALHACFTLDVVHNTLVWPITSPPTIERYGPCACTVRPGQRSSRRRKLSSHISQKCTAVKFLPPSGIGARGRTTSRCALLYGAGHGTSLSQHLSIARGLITRDRRTGGDPRLDHASQRAVGCQVGAREWLVGLVCRGAPFRIDPARDCLVVVGGPVRRDSWLAHETKRQRADKRSRGVGVADAFIK